ncbi:sigma 54-interacting transcriptional regulator [Haliangium ochraceum]|uniref:Sigma54 specific transcriptional regulator, Fis family n=1 Tax=Haliangium ochraceum (strain DSM 14365 / JCM 11303 / SMP-2) TaxID=502025 RepID=D0LUW9_HALO1|nr:sigma 54-interacting transcriptional regulator [Haliangium ochraceum]ACY14009.1 sigma54 specific transcriptional regulator, Fis family [Haliangium ochraceum DSM 14365]
MSSSPVDNSRTVAGTTLGDATAAVGRVGAPQHRAFLAVYSDAADSRTRMVALPDGVEVVFGRSRACAVHVDSERVSRHHARLVRRGGELMIEDLGSRNGTRVNGERIAEATALGSGDEIAIGPVTAVVGVTSGLERRHDIAEAAELDARLAAEADRGQRYQRSFALVMMQLQGSDEAIDEALDRLVARVRPMDTLAEYSPSEYAVLVPETDAATGMDAARELLRTAREQHLDSLQARAPVHVRAGLAVFPRHASQAGELLSRAQGALRRALAEDVDEPVVAAGEEPAPSDDELVIRDPQMQRVHALVRKVADTNITVLILGETGVGKEVVAEAVHRSGGRQQRPFVRLNCASIPGNLLESELFGHVKGAFTGADRQHTGYFEAASGGTLFLDEIGEMPAALQAKLLRVLEQRRITRVGDTREIAVDTRVVCATHRDLEDEVRQGRFREDLYFRISVFTVLVPPLRDRVSEIAPLAHWFARRAAREQGGAAPRLSDEALAVLEGHQWPGNVRELRNAVERACVLQEAGVILPEHLPERLRDARAPAGPGALAGANTSAASAADGPPAEVDVREYIATVERDAIVAALEECGGNQTHAARRLGMSRRSLIYKLEKYGLKKKPGQR